MQAPDRSARLPGLAVTTAESGDHGGDQRRLAFAPAASSAEASAGEFIQGLSQFRNLTPAEAVLVLTGWAVLSVSRRTEAASATATIASVGPKGSSRGAKAPLFEPG